MAYNKRTYGPGREDVTYVDMNRIEQGIVDNEQAITAALASAKSYADTQANKRVLQTSYDTKMTALDNKNTDQDAEIGKKTTTSLNGTQTNVNFIKGESGIISGIEANNQTLKIQSLLLKKQIQEYNTNFIKPVKNLFNKDNLSIGYINGQTGQLGSSTSYRYTDYIPIENNVDYVTKWWRFIAVYDESYNLLKEQGLVCTTPVGDTSIVNFAVGKYIRVTVTSASINTQMFYQGTEFESGIYYPYELEIPNLKKIKEDDLEGALISKVNNVGASVLNGESVLNFGDSIAYGAGNNGVAYADIIATRNNMTVYDYAKSGSTMSYVADKTQICTQVEAAYSGGITNIDYILFNGGVNDMFADRVVGEILDGYNRTWDLTTFCGGFEKALHLMRTYWLNAKIIYVIPHNMNTRDSILQKQIVDKAIEICNKWSIPYVDLYRNGGMNTNIVQYKLQYTNASDGTHPNELGYNTFYVPQVEAKMKSI